MWVQQDPIHNLLHVAKTRVMSNRRMAIETRVEWTALPVRHYLSFRNMHHDVNRVLLNPNCIRAYLVFRSYGDLTGQLPYFLQALRGFNFASRVYCLFTEQAYRAHLDGDPDLIAIPICGEDLITALITSNFNLENHILGETLAYQTI
mmetsp:Transcript_863/g.2279  ORF Transcript_863/g.2279 Transcript_863/m.2279 type:complete len:148 (+) Transcript_863:329-772(+)